MVQALVPEADSARDPRLRVLDPFVDQIRLWATQPGDGSAIEFDEWTCPLDPWVARTVQRFCNSEPELADETDKVVTEGIAVMAKCLADLCPRSDYKDDVNSFFATQAELMLDVAVGMALVKEMQANLDWLHSRGDVEQARALSRFHHALRNMILDVRRAIGETEKARASELAEIFLPVRQAIQANASAAAGEDGEENEERPPRAAREYAKLNLPVGRLRAKAKIIITHRRPKRSASHEVALVCLMLLATVTISATMLARRSADAVETGPVPIAGALEGFPEIDRIQDRPPYVVLTANGAFWESTAEAARLEWVQSITQQAMRGGYEGLVVRTADGRPLAEWVKGHQVKILEQVAPADRRYAS